jgi:hypothetical protein
MIRKKSLTIGLVHLLIILFAAAGCEGMVVSGSGNIIEEERDVEGFNKVELSVPANLSIVQGEEESLRIEGDDNIVEMIITEVLNESLKIRFKDQGFVSIRPTKTLKIYLSVVDINVIDLSGSGRIEAPNITTGRLDLRISGSAETIMTGLSAETLNVTLSGSGSFNMSGKVDRQSVELNGSGDYYAKELESSACNISMSGSGSAVVNATDSLDVKISGSGDIKYLGDPEINQSISGSGSVKKLSE